jgi:hypothetical protein
MSACVSAEACGGACARECFMVSSEVCVACTMCLTYTVMFNICLQGKIARWHTHCIGSYPTQPSPAGAREAERPTQSYFLQFQSPLLNAQLTAVSPGSANQKSKTSKHAPCADPRLGYIAKIMFHLIVAFTHMDG